jgi:hypothetical protein
MGPASRGCGGDEASVDTPGVESRSPEAAASLDASPLLDESVPPELVSPDELSLPDDAASSAPPPDTMLDPSPAPPQPSACAATSQRMAVGVTRDRLRLAIMVRDPMVACTPSSPLPPECSQQHAYPSDSFQFTGKPRSRPGSRRAKPWWVCQHRRLGE